VSLPDLAGILFATLAGGIQAAGAGAADAVASVAAVADPAAVERRLRFLSWAYTAVWLILAAYLLLLSMRQRRLERQVRLLRERLSPPGPTLRP
jgi:CcmD family protein